MPYGPVVIYQGVIASAASTADFDVAKAWSRIYADIPSLSTNAELTVWGSSDGSTYRVVYERVNTAPVQFQTMTIASSANNKIVPLPGLGLRYLKLAASGTVTNGATINLICSD